MNREILFKGQCKDDNEWVEGYYVQARDISTDEIIHLIVNEPEYYGHGEMAGMYEVYPETVRQFVGLSDKYSVKIFEHDAVWLDLISEKGYVKWASNQATFVIEFSERLLVLDNYWAKRIEVTHG